MNIYIYMFIYVNCIFICMYRHGVNMRHCGYLRSEVMSLLTSSLMSPTHVTAAVRTSPTSSPRHSSSRAVHDTAIPTTINNNSHRAAELIQLRQSRVHCTQFELLLQCISRTLKNLLRDILREWIQSRRSVAEYPMRERVVQFLNLITGANRNSAVFWRNHVVTGIKKRFVTTIYCYYT